MLELKGVLADFRDETQVVDVTPTGQTERVLIASVAGWQLTIHGSGPQQMSPGDMLKWIDDNVGAGRRVRVTLEADNLS